VELEIECRSVPCIAAIIILFIIIIVVMCAVIGWAVSMLVSLVTGRSVAHGIVDYIIIGLATMIAAWILRPKCECRS